MDSEENGQKLLGLQIIPHNVEGQLIAQRLQDGYVNATAMCKAVGKLFADYRRLSVTEAFLVELSGSMGIPIDRLVVTIATGPNQMRGTWVSPDVAVNLGQWCSAKFAVAVSRWVREWANGQITAKAELPYHIRRYLANRAAVPRGHWSMLQELTLAIIAPLEEDGYTLPQHMVPDISEGRMFSDWLRDAHEVDPKTFPNYPQEYEDGRKVLARAYPDAWLPEFRRHLYDVWIPTRMTAYFYARDQKALPYLQKLLPAPKKNAPELDV